MTIYENYLNEKEEALKSITNYIFETIPCYDNYNTPRFKWEWPLISAKYELYNWIEDYHFDKNLLSIQEITNYVKPFGLTVKRIDHTDKTDWDYNKKIKFDRYYLLFESDFLINYQPQTVIETKQRTVGIFKKRIKEIQTRTFKSEKDRFKQAVLDAYPTYADSDLQEYILKEALEAPKIFQGDQLECLISIYDIHYQAIKDYAQSHPKDVKITVMPTDNKVSQYLYLKILKNLSI